MIATNLFNAFKVLSIFLFIPLAAMMLMVKLNDYGSKQ